MTATAAPAERTVRLSAQDPPYLVWSADADDVVTVVNDGPDPVRVDQSRAVLIQGGGTTLEKRASLTINGRDVLHGIVDTGSAVLRVLPGTTAYAPSAQEVAAEIGVLAVDIANEIVASSLASNIAENSGALQFIDGFLETGIGASQDVFPVDVTGYSTLRIVVDSVANSNHDLIVSWGSASREKFSLRRNDTGAYRGKYTIVLPVLSIDCTITLARPATGSAQGFIYGQRAPAYQGRAELFQEYDPSVAATDPQATTKAYSSVELAGVTAGTASAWHELPGYSGVALFQVENSMNARFELETLAADGTVIQLLVFENFNVAARRIERIQIARGIARIRWRNDGAGTGLARIRAVVETVP